VTLAGVGAVLFVPGAPLQGDMPVAAPRFGEIPLQPAAPQGTFTKTAEPPAGQRLIPGSITADKGLSLEARTADGSRGTFKTGQAVTVTGQLDPAPAPQPRWSQAVVPIILVVFLIPGLAYGIKTGAIRKQSDVTKAFVHSMATMAPIIAMAFFAAQFIEVFRFSQLDSMIANVGGKALVASDLPKPMLLVGVIIITMIINLLMSSMSAKWTALSMILVPMLMMAGISPELTQGAYRVGDSVTNIITPLNSYIIVILATVQRYRKDAGIGNLIAMMLPYSVVFFFVWTAFLLGWVALGIPLGPGAPLWYVPSGQ
jgi:aminobenzoyl-glutamate transport protein